MGREFDRGYYRQPYRDLVSSFPDESVYPLDSFRVEWGPVFHRGRLDGSARVLIIGQDPATHEAIARRILVGEAGQRAQGLLTRLGIERSYVFINTFLYSVFGQGGGSPAHRRSGDHEVPEPVDQRDRGGSEDRGDHHARAARRTRRTSSGGRRRRVLPARRRTRPIRHPTYPESASRSGQITKAEAFAKLCDSWNQMLTQMHPVVTPDVAGAASPVRHDDHEGRPDGDPARDLPPGLPAWMCALDAWALRTGETAQLKRATITVTVPTAARTWPPVVD